MSQETAHIDLDDSGFDQQIDITFNVSGSNSKATYCHYYEPANWSEWAKIDLIKVTLAGICIIDQLSEEHIQAIEAACWESLEEGHDNV